MKVAILTMFNGLSPTYSLVNVVADQLRMLLAAGIHKETGKAIRLLFCDFPCADIDPTVYKTVIRMEGKRFGLEEGDLHFTSDLGYPDGFPRQGVWDLFTVTNLFVCPSRSESFGLTVLEAASRGNFLVLNEAVPALKELGDTLGAYFLRWNARNFDCDTHETYHPSEEAYYAEHGRRIAEAMDRGPALRAKTAVRTRYSLQWIWEHQLLPPASGIKIRASHQRDARVFYSSAASMRASRFS